VSPGKTIEASSGLTSCIAGKHEITALRQSIRDFLATKVEEGIAPFRDDEGRNERTEVAAVLYYMVDSAGILAERLEEEGFTVSFVKKKNKKRKRSEREEEEVEEAEAEARPGQDGGDKEGEREVLGVDVRGSEERTECCEVDQPEVNAEAE
jgi:hypothetical protein